MVRVAISVPEPFRARAEYVFRFFSQLWGVPVTFSDSPSEPPDVSYSSSPDQGRSESVHVPFDGDLYEPGCACGPVEHEGEPLWAKLNGSVDSLDVVASTYRLLTLLDEHQVDPSARDRRGVFRSEALPAPRRRVTQLPLVDHQAEHLFRRLVRARPALTQSAVPKWPGGKKYALALTHDTDAVSLGAAKELATNLAKYAIRRDRTFRDMFTAGLRHVGDPTGNPYFGFPLWRELEAARELRSCFYLFARVTRLKRDMNDCKSSVVEQRIDWGVLRQMARERWEFGLHAPINAKNQIDAFVQAKQWIEEKLDAPIYGLRHHYWALDWMKPYRTFRRHVNSGFRYDTSIAWRDVSGFRAATCHPFRPFDPERDKALDLYEIPTSLMDGHVITGDGDLGSAVRSALETIARVKERGGVAVLDWHTETACDSYAYRGYSTALRLILEPLLEDGEIWFATPWEIGRHWHRRRLELEAA